MKKLPIVALGLLLACSCSDSNGGSDPGGGAGGSPGGGGSGGGACTGAGDCAAGQSCDPGTLQCVAGAACSSHGDCGAAAHCGEAGVCTPSETGSPCEADVSCPSGESCRGGFCGCGGDAYSATSVPPNVLIVLDRSGSMNEDIPGGTKWDVAREAITALLAGYGGDIRFGLALYPGTNQSCNGARNCEAGTVFIDPAQSTAAQIDAFLADAGTCSAGTPTGEMLASLPGYAGLEDPSRPNYVLLITDGQSTCDDPVPEVTALRGEQPEVKTFVVGFGAGVDPDELEGMAQAGGTALAGGPPGYFVAGDATALGEAFATIAGSILSCSFTLSDVPPDLEALYIYQNRQPVLRDPSHGGGWDYDAGTNQITFYAAECNALQSGQVTELTIVYGCPLELQ